MTNLKKEIKDVTGALEVIYASPIGKNVLYDLRNHSEPSKQTLELLGKQEEKIDTNYKEVNNKFMPSTTLRWLIGTMITLILIVIKVQFSMIDIIKTDFKEEIQGVHDRLDGLEEILTNNGLK